MRAWESNELGAQDVTAPAAARIRRRFFLAVGGKRRLIDKTPRNSLRVPFVHELFPDASYVFLKRDWARQRELAHQRVAYASLPDLQAA